MSPLFLLLQVPLVAISLHDLLYFSQVPVELANIDEHRRYIPDNFIILDSNIESVGPCPVLRNRLTYTIFRPITNIPQQLLQSVVG